MTDTLHDDADDLLHWLNAHSVSISDGIPFLLMQQKWTATQRPHIQLRSSLEWLFDQGLLMMTPGLEQPHIRLSSKGFEQLLRAMDSARQSSAAAAAAATAEVQDVVLAAAAVGSFNPSPLPAPATPVAQPAANSAALAAASEAPPANRFLPFGKPPTEIGLRNQVLAIFRDLKLSAGQQLIAMTLTRYWQETGQRGEYLRAAIDVMLRDGYLESAVKRYENYWALTKAGHAFISAPLSHPALLALAQPLRQIEPSHPDADLRRKGLGLFKGATVMSFNALENSWRHSRDALIHALDLLIKSGEVQMSETEALSFELTGRALANRR